MDRVDARAALCRGTEKRTDLDDKRLVARMRTMSWRVAHWEIEWGD